MSANIDKNFPRHRYPRIHRSKRTMTANIKASAKIIHQTRPFAGSRISNSLARRCAGARDSETGCLAELNARKTTFETGWVSHSSGRLKLLGGWRPDQPDPIGAARASPTPAEVLTFHANDYKRSR